MTKNVILYFLLTQVLLTLGQTSVKINALDSALLCKNWTKFAKDFSDKKTTDIKKTSLAKVECAPCTYFNDPKTPIDNFVIPIDTFLNEFYRDLPTSKLWTVIKADKKEIRATEIHKSLQGMTKKPTKTIVYEVWFHTYKKNELSKGHEGAQHYFEFIKVGDKFMFCGFGAVP